MLPKFLINAPFLTTRHLFPTASHSFLKHEEAPETYLKLHSSLSLISLCLPHFLLIPQAVTPFTQMFQTKAGKCSDSLYINHRIRLRLI